MFQVLAVKVRPCCCQRCILVVKGAGERSRTSTPLRGQEPESCASANSATPARADKWDILNNPVGVSIRVRLIRVRLIRIRLIRIRRCAIAAGTRNASYFFTSS